MNRPSASLVALPLVAALAAGCSSSSHPATVGPSDAAAGATDAALVPFPDGPTTFSMTSITVAPSTEAFKCTYVQMPATPGFIIGGAHEFTPGSHHLLVYRTNLATIPAGLASPTIGDCYEGSTAYMSTLTGVLYPAATPKGGITMPEGVGLPYAANEVLLFQVHYINTTAAPLSPQVYVRLDTQTTPVQQNAGVLFFYDPFIYVPQGGMAKASLRCPIPSNITMFSEGSHYHARGVDYQAYLDPASGPPATTPFYTSNDWASPTIQLNTMQVSAGSYIRYYCDYDNTQGQQAFIQGQSAATNEMCMFVGLYYPAMSQADEQCFNGDQFGTGTASCTTTLSCLQACPPNDVGDAGGEIAMATYNSCIQQCMSASCAGVSDPLESFLQCLDGPCNDACNNADAGTADCTTCIAAQCASQYQACSSQTCN